MAGPLFTNNATGTLAAAYSASAVALTLTAGQGVKFPSPAAGEWFPMTLVDISNNIEIVHCTARTADTCTVSRGMEGTAARALGVGEKVEHRLTAGSLNAIRDRPLDPSQIPDGSITSAKLANGAVISSKLAPLSVFASHINNLAVGPQHLDTGAALANLGYAVVQNGTGIGQNSSQVKLGWTAAGKLRATIDGTDIGYLLNEKDDGSVASAGYRGLPTNLQNAHYTLALGDAGKQVLHTAGAHTYWMPTDAAVPLLLGTVVKLVNREGAGVVTINAAAGVTLRWVPTGATGPRTLTSPGSCIVEKMDGANWWIYGLGLS
jgi:hypothetical protein